MLNRDGITKSEYGMSNQILANVEHQASCGCRVPQTMGVDDGKGRKIVKAGTPIQLDCEDLQKEVEEGGATAGEFTLEILTAFFTDESLTIDGTTYTNGLNESKSEHIFEGNTIKAQVASLIRIITDDEYDVRSGESDVLLRFVQKKANEKDTTGPAVSTSATTGAVGGVTKIVDPVEKIKANAVLLHDVDVTNGTSNGTALFFGIVNAKRLDPEVKSKMQYGINIFGGVSVINY